VLTRRKSDLGVFTYDGSIWRVFDCDIKRAAIAKLVPINKIPTNNLISSGRRPKQVSRRRPFKKTQKRPLERDSWNKAK